MEMQMIDMDYLVESKTNPRKTFDKKQLDELTQSIKEKGVVQPILVRPNLGDKNTNMLKAKFEIVTGARRFNAAKAAGLTEIPAMIRELSDQEAMEIQVIENLQRANVHPLEEAEGYFALNRRPGMTAAKIAEKIGQSEKYVYDRLKLLSLTKDAQKLFLAGKFSVGHAIILARLTPEAQGRCLDNDSGGMFEHEFARHLYDEEKEDEPLKPKTTRELQAWIDEHVRFDHTKVDQMIFPETAKVLEKAEKVVQITEDWFVQPSARNDQKIISPRSWMRADGKEKSKTCEHAVTGVFVVGPNRGESMKVCIAKEKCKIHWGAWQKERAARGKGDNKKADNYKGQLIKEQQKRKDEEAKKKLWHERFKKAAPQLIQAVNKALLNLPCDATGPIAKIILAWMDDNCATPDKKTLPKGKTAEDFIRHLCSIILIEKLDCQYQAPYEDDVIVFKMFGLDINKMVNELVPEKAAAAVKVKKLKKGVCHKCGCTHNNPCQGGCAWTDKTETLCTACA